MYSTHKLVISDDSSLSPFGVRGSWLQKIIALGVLKRALFSEKIQLLTAVVCIFGSRLELQALYVPCQQKLHLNVCYSHFTQ